MQQTHLGLIGLGVMGANLALNISDHGFPLTVYNRTTPITDEFIQQHARGRALYAAHSLEDLIQQLPQPRVVMLMVTAGRAVDAVIQQLLPLLAQGDIIIDGGNSNYQNTERRWQDLQPQGIHFIGMGVSGGEEGARHGPSLMPGGAAEAWPHIRPIFQAVAAQADGQACCQWLGQGGAGHYVKMVHNGIEYGDMQLIAEACQLMQYALGMDSDAIADTFARWNQGRLESYLIEITSHIWRQRDQDGTPLVHKILDRAGQKGTGLWTAQDALDHAVPLTLITEAVHARMLSARKQERLAAAAILNETPTQPIPSEERETYLTAIHDALYAAKLVSYAQGFMLLQTAAEETGWDLPYGDIALLWRAGCIIRSRFLDDIQRSFQQEPAPASLLQDSFFANELNQVTQGWRKAVSLAVMQGIPAPALSSALAFYDGYRRAQGSANILQAQRDYFGAHSYQRIDREPERRFHTHWTEDGREEEVQ